MKVLRDLLFEINQNLILNINATSDFENIGTTAQFWEESMQTERDGKTFPIVNQGNGDGALISPDDSYPLQIWHRKINGNYEENPDMGRGADNYRWKVYDMRLVCFGYFSRLPQKTWETNDEVATVVYNAMPQILQNKEIVILGEELTNKQEVFENEFTEHDLKHLAFELIAFTIDYQVKQLASRSCNLTPTTFVNYADITKITANHKLIS